MAKPMGKPEFEIEIHVDASEVDYAIEKVGRLLALLNEAQEKMSTQGLEEKVS